HGGQLPNQSADISRHGRTTGAPSALPRPEQTKAAAMPCDHRLGLNDVERRAPGAPGLGEPCPQHPVGNRKTKPWMARSIDDGQLVPKRQDLQMQLLVLVPVEELAEQPRRAERPNGVPHTEKANGRAGTHFLDVVE